MLGLVQSWFTPGANPIGVDFGSDSLRMAQVEVVSHPRSMAAPEYRLVAAARAEVPPYLRDDFAGRLDFFAETVRELHASGSFRGRKAVLAMPASLMSILHLRLPRLDDDALKKALFWEAQGKLPYEPGQAILRHLIAGEVYQEGDQKSEIILMAAERDAVERLLSAASRGRLDVVGMNIEPRALVDCFAPVNRRKSDQELASLLIDIGGVGTRAVIVRAGQIMFARAIPIGGDVFNHAVAGTIKVDLEKARLMRIRRSLTDVGASAEAALAGANEAGGLEPLAPAEIEAVDRASREPLAKLIEELRRCRHYYEAAFPNIPMGRVIFVGGEARQRNICRDIARALELSAQLGDPMVHLGSTAEVGPESGIDRRHPQPDWAVAIGLSMGPPAPKFERAASTSERADTRAPAVAGR